MEYMAAGAGQHLLDANEVEPVLRTGFFGIHVSLMIAGYGLAICTFVASLVAIILVA